jgi:hypothetical protein
METAENAVELALTGGTASCATSTFWLALPPAAGGLLLRSAVQLLHAAQARPGMPLSQLTLYGGRSSSYH